MCVHVGVCGGVGGWVKKERERERERERTNTPSPHSLLFSPSADVHVVLKG